MILWPGFWWHTGEGFEGGDTGERETNGGAAAFGGRQDGRLVLTNSAILNSWCFGVWHTRHKSCLILTFVRCT